MGSLIFANPHREALTPNTQLALQTLDREPFIRNFYLAGGTGLALHLGHRYSVDLDFFSIQGDALEADQRAAIRRVLAAAIKYAQVSTFAMNAVRAMAYFEDAEALPMPEMLQKVSWAEVKRFLLKQSTQAGRHHLDDLWDR